jgi:hypothetical protein
LTRSWSNERSGEFTSGLDECAGQQRAAILVGADKTSRLKRSLTLWFARRMKSDNLVAAADSPDFERDALH